jgi:hypothetical protein
MAFLQLHSGMQLLSCNTIMEGIRGPDQGKVGNI